MPPVYPAKKILQKNEDLIMYNAQHEKGSLH